MTMGCMKFVKKVYWEQAHHLQHVLQSSYRSQLHAQWDSRCTLGPQIYDHGLHEICQGSLLTAGFSLIDRNRTTQVIKSEAICVGATFYYPYLEFAKRFTEGRLTMYNMCCNHPTDYNYMPAQWDPRCTLGPQIYDHGLHEICQESLQRAGSPCTTCVAIILQVKLHAQGRGGFKEKGPVSS